jgi:hypothetical protein
VNKTREYAAASHQEAMAEVRRVVAEAKELSGAADGALTDHLAAWMAGRYAIATRQLALENGDGTVDWNLLRALCHDLVDLRRGDHSAESLRLERERWEAEKAEAKEDLEKRFWEWAKDNQEKICKGINLTEEERRCQCKKLSDAERRTIVKTVDEIMGLSSGEEVPEGPPPTQENAK